MKKWLFSLIMVFSASVISLQAQTYCTTGLYTSGCTYGDNLNDVTIGTLVQTATGCSTGAYADYTTDTITIAQTEATSISVTSGYSTQWFALWVDGNDDGDFDDAGEFLWNSTSASGTAGTATTGSFVIPTSVLVGNHRLRLRGHYAGSAFTATQSCSSFTYGETHDYIVKVLIPPVCPAPYGGFVTATTAYSSTLHWVSTGTSFSIEYGAAGFTLGSGTTVTSTTDSVVITGLTPATTYSYYVQNNCTGSSNGLSNWSGATNFTTGCAPFSAPFTEDFDNTATGNSSNPSAPQCWNYLENAGHNGYGYTYQYSTPNSAPNHFYMYNSNNITDSMLLVSPPIIGLDSSNKQVVFWAKSNTSSYSSPVVVGTMSDPTDISTFHTIATVQAGQNYSEFTVQIDGANGYNGTDMQIAFMYKSPVTYRYLYLDDITVEAIPACPKPLFITLGTTTSSSQAVSWTSAGTSFNLEWGPTGFTQGTGFSGTSTTNSFNMTGLADNSTYDVYIQNNCAGAGNGVSVWAGPITFTTYCNAFVGPVMESFESTPAGSSANPTTPDCWRYTTTTHGGYNYGYTRDYSLWAHGGSKFFYMYNSNTTDTVSLVSPAIGGMDTVDKHIQFWARAGYSGTSYNEHIIIGTVSDPTNISGMSVIDTVLISGTTYQFHDVYLDAANGYNGTDLYIVMALWTGTSTYGYAVIDDITIDNVPSCTPSTGLNITNVTNATADVSWLAGDGLAYNIEYGPTGFTQGTGPIVTGLSATNYSLSGLAGNTCYDVYVRDSCALATSPWFGPITFCTSCDPIATPIVEDFETATPGSSANPTAPDCWTNWESINASGWSYVYPYSTPNGTQHYYMYNYNSATDTQAIISPAVAGITNGDKVLKFQAKSNSSSSNTWAIVGTSASSADLSNSTILDTVYPGQNYGTEYTVYIDSMSGYNGTDQYIFIMHTGATAPYYYLYLDDISITDIPACAAPWNMAVSNVTSSAATASWNNLTGTSFQIEYGPTGFIPGTGLATTVNSVASPYTITGLNPNTFYDFYVADMCDTTNQAGPFTFKTECTAQLSGTYTIGGTPGATNFATLDSALSVLTGCGVSGPVTFNLQGGTHNTSIAMNQIAGASATNTVTFNGMGVAMDTIDIPSGLAIGMNFNGTAYVTFKNITINADGTNRAVWFHEGANHITFENCDILATVSTSGLYAAIVAAKTETSVTSTGDNANHITIKGCNIDGGYYGISFTSTGSTSFGTTIVLENNTITNAYYYGVRVYYYDNVTITGNDISLSYTYSYGMYLYYISNFNVSGNNSIAGGYGLYSYYLNYNITPSNRSTISNNFFGGATYGLGASYPNAVNILHNTSRGNNRGLYMYAYTASSLETDVRNNIFYGSSGEAMYFSNSQGGNITADYNLYYTGGSNVAYWKNAAVANLAALQAADTANNDNSLQGDPGFLSTTDFHITGTLPNDVADNNTSIVVDIDGDSRPASGSTTKDIGADEFTPLNWDASLEALIVPLGGCGDSTAMVQAVVKNFGLNTITALPITVNYNGGMTGTVGVSAVVSIAQGATDTVNVGTFNTYAGAAGVNFTGYTSLVGDQKGVNDTMSVGPGNYVPVEPVTHGMIDTVCASVDSVSLWAVHIPGTEYAWYDAAVAGNKVANGDSVMVPTNGITTYYVAYDSATANPQVGMGTVSSGTSTYITPYKTYYMDGRAQYLILASELQAMGVAGGEINSLAFDVVAAGGQVLNDFTIKIGGTSVSQMTGSYEPNTGFTTVYTANYSTTVGWNVHTFTTPYIWNGADNLIVEVCYDNNSWTSNAAVYYSTTSFASVCDGYADLSAGSGCTPGQISNQQASTSRPNMLFNMKTIACSEVRKPVSFAVNSDTASAMAFTTTVNANGADVDFDGSASTGDVYTWNFGDGNTGTGAMAAHTYATAGTWTACLVVEDTVCNTTDSICQTVVTTIGLDESLLNQTLNVFPNPNNGKFRVEFQVEGLKNVTLRVNTLLGQEIYTSKPGNVSGEYREEIDLSNEATGVYVLQILTDDSVISRRITIRK